MSRRVQNKRIDAFSSAVAGFFVMVFAVLAVTWLLHPSTWELMPTLTLTIGWGLIGACIGVIFAAAKNLKII